ncbi:MAG: hypothetical protein H0T11_06765 [Chthoniobacterales bacterium]|nr:hypothetical protein [Chthoniobacterales bacterium]
MALAVYLLCAVASLVCALLLARGYRASGMRLLFWGALCFFILTGTNSLLFVDMVIFPQLDLAAWRSGLTLGAFSLLLYGLIFESQT